MPIIQESIHSLEVAGGRRYLKIGLAVLGVAAVILLYNWLDFKNMSNPEAMDAAQLGRNLAEGRGYTTLVIRPFSTYLVKRRIEQDMASAGAEKLADSTQIKTLHPDVSNAPVYPVVLAGALKALGLDYSIPLNKSFWSNAGQFWRYKPDFVISLLNQLFFFGVIVSFFFLTRRLFDGPTAWLSAGLLFGSELLWRFSVSGLSTMLLMLIFSGLIWCLVLAEEEGRAPTSRLGRWILLAVLAGALTGLGALTRYAFGWLIVPVLVFLLVFGGTRRLVLALAALVAFAGVMTPWVVRNYEVSGTPFGTAGYAVYETTFLFPEDRLERSLEPNFALPNRARMLTTAFSWKLLTNTRQIIEHDLPRLGGNWIGAFFLVGLLVGFGNPAATRLRYFLLASLAVFLVVQAMGRTQLSEDSPDVNSENLLVLLTPLVLIYAAGFFLLLLSQIYLPIRELRYVVVGVFCTAACAPMIFAFLPPKSSPVANGPYSPLTAQVIGGWMRTNELAMSDLPWAVAWYGQRQTMWVPLNLQPDFYTINDFKKPVAVVYLTQRTLDKQPTSSWGILMLQTLLSGSVPTAFPLHKAPPRDRESNPAHLQGGQMVLTDRDRWKKAP